MNVSPTEYQKTYDSIAPGYYFKAMQNGPSIQRFWHRQKFLSVARMIPEGARVLDVGCGPGSFASILAEKNPTCIYTGLDIAHAQLAFGAENVTSAGKRVAFAQFDGDRLPIRDRAVDCVVMIELLEHLEISVKEKLLAECRRALKPGGRLIVTTPNYRSHWPAIEWVLNKVSPVKYDEQHISKFSSESLARSLTKAGFTVETMSSFFCMAPFVSGLGEKFAVRLLAFERNLSFLPGALLLASARPS